MQIDQAERLKVIGARIREGRDTYAGRLDAWHALGSVTGKFNTWRELYEAAGAAFQVMKFQLEFQGELINSWGTFRIDAEIPKGITPTKKITLADKRDYYLTFLGTVGEGYQVIQHTDSFELLDHLVGQVDGAHYETMGTLEFGRLIWAQVDPNFSIRVGDDVSNIFLTAHTSHDGSKAFDIFETGTREVCRNTFRIGSLKRLANTLRVRHTKGAQKRIESLKAEIDEIKNVALTMQDRLLYLSKRKVTKESLTTIMDRLFPPKMTDDGVPVESTRRNNILSEVLAIYEDNDGNTFPEQRGTAYNLWNAVTNYTDHARSTKGDGRAEAAVFGSGDRLKASALDLIMAEAEKNMSAMPERVVIGSFADIGLNVN